MTYPWKAEREQVPSTTYRGCEIVVDEDFKGQPITYVYMGDGGDPIEVADRAAAIRVIDQCLEDLAAYGRGE